MANSIIGTNGSIGAGLDAGDAVEPTPLEHGDDHAVGGADRQQVHDHRLQRHQQRPEHRHQQQERQRQHRPEEVRQAGGEVLGEVDLDGTEPVSATSTPAAFSTAGSTSDRRRSPCRWSPHPAANSWE
jgi:hypothetical protein